ncbi:MAG: D-alanyl-D-alanine dipeptidase [Janthinobacterium lividum]
MLVPIIAQKNLLIKLAYATEENFTNQKIYQNDPCFLHTEAHDRLMHAFELAQGIGYGFKIFDAFRPVEAQEKLWQICPNPMYVADPKRGSPHGRSIAVDLTLIDDQCQEIDMGTPFDSFDKTSHHCNLEISPVAQRNRFILLGIMMAAGFDLYKNEWWHYQLFNPLQYPLLKDNEAPVSLMKSSLF